MATNQTRPKIVSLFFPMAGWNAGLNRHSKLYGQYHNDLCGPRRKEQIMKYMSNPSGKIMHCNICISPVGVISSWPNNRYSIVSMF
jgi:hypothetical protein